MPTTYAHDLFGKEVYKKLPSDMKALIRRHGDLYRIGLHGPDILFYYMVSKNPVTQFGIDMHHEKARAFFEEGMRQVRRNNDEALLAYLLGFGCHYMFDSACHPYVNQMAAEGVVPHIVLEKEFDRVLMEETSKDPDHYYPACGIVPKMEYAKVIHRAIPLVKTINIYLSVKIYTFFVRSFLPRSVMTFVRRNYNSVQIKYNCLYFHICTSALSLLILYSLPFAANKNPSPLTSENTVSF